MPTISLRYYQMLAPIIAHAQELGADNQALSLARLIAVELEAAQPWPPDVAS
jgi:hypothetical protein